ncbi:MAG TPA: DUF4382 domain-containing protein [Candidatus Binatia bacterium]|nr:DUF4382 domain-containing protein [Candidatus Binatia bacterium]
MSRSHFGYLGWAWCAVLMILLAACGSSGDDAAAPGAVSVSLTDGPACGFDAVYVTVSKVRIHQSDSASDNAVGWTDITLNPPRRINLLDLNDPTQPNLALEHLGETPLPAGHYTQLRLLLESNRNNPNPPFANAVVLTGTTTEIPLDTPSAVQSGIKLVHQFDVPPGQRVDLLLDFDACHSIVQRGNGTYGLKPVIKVIPFVLNGIEGFVAQSLLGSHVVVTAQTNGEIVRRTAPNAAGKFFLARLAAPANYDVVITADNRATAVISGVPVNTAAEIRTVSTNVAPIPVAPPALDTSLTRTVDGTVILNPATDEEVVFVAAKQALMSGPMITVKTVVAAPIATVSEGDFGYTLALPVAAPSLGPYTSTLPIVFTQQPSSVGGKYTIQASAAGYTSQSFNKDISAADQIQNFTLIP